MSSSPGLKRIRLNLARTDEFPDGSPHHGYVFVAPLDDNNHIDAERWRDVKEKCEVHRFWGDEDEEIGHLIHHKGGSWAFRYDIEGDDDDESGYKFGIHAFVPGEYVSIKDEDGELHAFKVISIEDA